MTPLQWLAILLLAGAWPAAGLIGAWQRWGRRNVRGVVALDAGLTTDVVESVRERVQERDEARARVDRCVDGQTRTPSASTLLATGHRRLGA